MTRQAWKGRLALAVVSTLFALPARAQGTPIPDGRPVPHPHAVRVFHVPAGSPTIQGAIERARDGDVVIVAPGTYVESIDFLGKAIEVIGVEGPTRTTIRPPSPNPVVRFRSGEGPDSRLMGFTIQGGDGDFFGSGGGVSCDAFGPVASPYLSDCIIQNNFTDPIFGYGPGAAGLDGNAILERCILRRNDAYFESGGAARGALTMLACVVEDNWGCEGGGGLHLLPGSLVQDSIIRRNSGGPCVYHGGAYEAPGGGIWAPQGPIEIVGCILQDNWVDEFTEFGDPGTCNSFTLGGGVNAGSGVTLRRCTITGNHVLQCAQVGGIQGSPQLVDSIVSGNEDAPGFYASQTAFRFSDVQGGAAGAGCFDADPLFENPGAGDLRLKTGSPCIDAGDPASPLDADGTRADLGALPRPSDAAPLGVVWHETPPFEPQDPTQCEGFGAALAIDGDTALIGAAEIGYGGEDDDAYVFRRTGASWSEEAHLARSDPQTDDDFGAAVALAGNVAVVGAPRHDAGAEDEGVVYVYERRSASAPFEETCRLAPLVQQPYAAFGTSVALDGGTLGGVTLVVGAIDSGSSASEFGHVFVFQRKARGRWQEVAVFTSPYYSASFAGPLFGAVVAIAGNTIVVGAPDFEVDNQLPGRAFVYERAGATPHSWVQSAVLVPVGTQGHGNFGATVSITGDAILVGSNFGAYAYERRGPGLPWARATRIGPFERTAVFAQGKHAWLSGAGHEIREFVQPSPGAPWSQVASFSPVSGPLAADQGTLLVGKPSEGASGAVHVFRRGVQVDSIAHDQAADEEDVVLRGLELDTVTEVRVGGVAQPIVQQSASELVLRPARRDPGFADLELVTPTSTLTLADRFESLPSLGASHNGLGGALRVRLNNGTIGAYRLHMSLDLLPTPFVLNTPPTWYHLLLRLTPGRSLLLHTDAFTSSGLAEPAFAIPSDPAFTGLTFHLQAWCRRGLFGPVQHSFTNLVSVTL